MDTAANMCCGLPSEGKHVIRQILACLVLSQTHVVLGVLVASGGLIVTSAQPGGMLQHLTSAQVTWILSVSLFGLAAGSLASAPLTNNFGVLRVAMCSGVINISAHVCLQLGQSAPLLMLGRALQGAFIGVNIGNSRIYIAEVVSERLRGFLCHIPSLISCCSFLGTVALAGCIPWQWAVLICGCFPSAIHLVGALVLPPSARWLASRGRYNQEAISSIRFFRGENHDAAAELKAIRTSVGGDDTRRIRSLLGQLKLAGTSWAHAKPVLLLVGQFAFEAFCGGVTIAQYAPMIFRHASPGLNPHTATLYLATCQLVSLCITAVLIGRLGRRVALSLAAVTGVIGSSLVAASTLATSSLRELPWLPLVGVLMANAAVQAGIAPISYIYMSELLPTAIRPLFGCCFIVYVSAINCATMQLFPVATVQLGTGGLFICIASACGLQLVYALVFLPETKGLTLEDVQQRHFSSRRKEKPANYPGEVVEEGNGKVKHTGPG